MFDDCLRKIWVVLLSIPLVFSLCACGNKGVDENKNTKKESTKVEASVETDKTDETDDATEEKDDEQAKVEEEKEQEAAKGEFVPVDISFTFDGTEFKLPSTVGAFVDAGWKPTVTSSDKLGFSKNNDDDSIIVHIHEMNTENFKDSVIDSVFINKNSFAEKPVELLIDGLKFREATLEEVVAKYGEPDEKKTSDSNYVTINYAKSNLQFVFNAENQLVTFLYEYEME